MRRNYLRFNDVAPATAKPGRPKALSDYHAEQLLQYLDQRPTAYQDEMVWFLYDEFELVVDRSTISRFLTARRWSKKIAKRVAAQQNDALREEWKLRLAGWGSEQLVFLDESAACERNGEFPKPFSKPCSGLLT